MRREKGEGRAKKGNNEKLWERNGMERKGRREGVTVKV